MAEHLAFLQTKNKESKAKHSEADTWIFQLPDDVCRREGFAEGTMVSLTVKNAGVLTTIIHPSKEIDDFVERIVEEEKEYFEEMKRIGD